MSLAVPLTHLTELAAAEACLAADLAGRDAAWAGQPSGLPGWTRAQVVGHLAGNAYGMVNLCEWAASGVETPMYPSPEDRAAEIDRRAVPALARARRRRPRGRRGAGRPARPTCRSRSAPGALRLGSGAPVVAADLASTRIREIEIHRVDLAAEYQPVDWAEPFTMRTLGQVTPFFRSHRDVPVQMLRSVDSGRCWEVGTHRSGPARHRGRPAGLAARTAPRPAPHLRRLPAPRRARLGVT